MFVIKGHIGSPEFSEGRVNTKQALRTQLCGQVERRMTNATDANHSGPPVVSLRSLGQLIRLR